MSETLYVLEIITSVEAELPVCAFVQERYQCTVIVEQMDKSPDVSCKVYFTDPPDSQDMELRIRHLFDQLRALNIHTGCEKIIFSTLAGQDWLYSWQTHFKPFKAGKRLVIKPVWEKWDKQDDNELIIEYEPGMAFGTGQHATTRFCLEMIDRYVKKDMSVLDIGCGSAVLAIASAKLGAEPVHGFDNDPVALEHAQLMVKLNGVEDKVQLQCASVEQFNMTREYDFVVANLFAEILIKYAVQISRFVNKNGFLALTGIIDNKTDHVRVTYEQLGLRTRSEFTENEWNGLLVSY